MQIKMMGIDHNKAAIEYREKFSLTTSARENILKNFIAIKGILGCVVISTCNRMEIWISCENDFNFDIYNVFCRMNGINEEEFRDYFIQRIADEAVIHLFYLTCGMKSKVVGEDQILTQVKEALVFSRENYCTDNVMEVLFRMAVTAGKKVKDQIHLSKSNTSIVHQVMCVLKNMGVEFENKKCLVIGNGEIGKLAATLLKEENAHVTVTVRQYKSGIVEIPKGCNRIDYGERLNNIADYDIVVSGTASPNVTLSYEHLKNIEFKNKKHYIDLAVPRDIEHEVGSLENVQLYDIDYFHIEPNREEFAGQIKQIEEILEEYIQEFISWYKCKDVIPEVKFISEIAAIDVNLRLEKKIKKIEISNEEKEILEKSINDATGKVVNKLMFGLMDSLKPETFQECIDAIKKLY